MLGCSVNTQLLSYINYCPVSVHIDCRYYNKDYGLLSKCYSTSYDLLVTSGWFSMKKNQVEG